MSAYLIPFLVVAATTGACSHATPRASDTTSSARAATQPGSVPAAKPSPTDTISRRADRGRILGDSTASVWLVEASDFQCPFCKQWHDAAFPSIVKDYVNTGRVRVAFLNMPLNIHQFAKQASEAAMCASVQDRFWPMHDSLFATQGIWEKLQNPASMFDTLANENHVEMTAWRTCMEKHLTIPLIEADYDRARTAGVGSTPTFFAGGKVIPGADADVRGALDAALASKPTAKPPR
ncbi:MAG TPA: thioredoxin domain-containing protein [Gemmatimonadaceae bacterium]|nr:thioredoxin domain-containing protein [Gemmatimonadaceae bacterium]